MLEERKRKKELEEREKAMQAEREKQMEIERQRERLREEARRKVGTQSNDMGKKKITIDIYRFLTIR